jgi:hypothetical protein
MTNQRKPYSPFGELVRYEPFHNLSDIFTSFGLMPSIGDIGVEPRLKVDIHEKEDAFLVKTVSAGQCGSWEAVAKCLPGRTARQCRDRWSNYLSPVVRSGPWSAAEDELLVSKINEVGHVWSTLVRYFGGRSENDIKNRWYTHLRYRTISGGPHSLRIVGEDGTGRKKRNRKQMSPRQAVMVLLRQKQDEPQGGFVSVVSKSSPDREAELYDDWFVTEPMSEPFGFGSGVL